MLQRYSPNISLWGLSSLEYNITWLSEAHFYFESQVILMAFLIVTFIVERNNKGGEYLLG